MTTPNRRILLYTELLSIFIAMPLFFAFFSTFSPVTVLIFFSTVFTVYLYKNPTFKNYRFFSLKSLKQKLPGILLKFIVITAGLFLFTKYIYPDLLFICIKTKFSIWCTIMLVYPLLSVFPQEIIFRGFLFQRYRELFGSDRVLIHISALAFSFAHIIYFHPISIILTLGGGYLFAWTYQQTRSILITSLEHALYGCAIYTVGLGQFFYAGFDKIAG